MILFNIYQYLYFRFARDIMIYTMYSYVLGTLQKPLY